ncbi:protein ABIL3-like [Mangifera indica]|uniref:protein ABIL3-like n=1 Tax=Mangifera indica TaxID=29780 RepID=UPI001CF9FA59|nr:protein ABIL3-like [Mangifera indica]
MSSASSVSGPEKTSTYDEFFMQQSLLFADTLKDLKNLRRQLYSAAEFFETSYRKDSQKRIVVESVKDYAIKALINTVDHLGSVAFKVNNLFDEKIGKASETELRLTCLEQRVKSCQEFINGGGLSQQSLVIITPKHHKRYIFPDEETTDDLGQNPSSCENSSVSAEEDSTQLKTAAQVTTTESPSTYLREVQHTLQSPQPSARQGTFTFPIISRNKTPERRAASPLYLPFVRSGSLLKRSPSPNLSRAKRRYPSEPRRTVSLTTFAEGNMNKDFEQNSGKSKGLFKAFLSLRKSRKEATLYNFLDEN